MKNQFKEIQEAKFNALHAIKVAFGANYLSPEQAEEYSELYYEFNKN